MLKIDPFPWAARGGCAMKRPTVRSVGRTRGGLAVAHRARSAPSEAVMVRAREWRNALSFSPYGFFDVIGTKSRDLGRKFQCQYAGVAVEVGSSIVRGLDEVRMPLM